MKKHPLSWYWMLEGLRQRASMPGVTGSDATNMIPGKRPVRERN